MRHFAEQERNTIIQLHSSFEAMVQKHGDTGTEFWLARDLQVLLGYAQWRNFEIVIQKAVTACETLGHDSGDHFARISKMVDVGSGAKRKIEDIGMSR